MSTSSMPCAAPKPNASAARFPGCNRSSMRSPKTTPPPPAARWPGPSSRHDRPRPVLSKPAGGQQRAATARRAEGFRSRLRLPRRQRFTGRPSGRRRDRRRRAARARGPLPPPAPTALTRPHCAPERSPPSHRRRRAASRRSKHNPPRRSPQAAAGNTVAQGPAPRRTLARCAPTCGPASRGRAAPAESLRGIGGGHYSRRGGRMVRSTARSSRGDRWVNLVLSDRSSRRSSPTRVIATRGDCSPDDDPRIAGVLPGSVIPGSVVARLTVCNCSTPWRAGQSPRFLNGTDALSNTSSGQHP